MQQGGRRTFQVAGLPQSSRSVGTLLAVIALLAACSPPAPPPTPRPSPPNPPVSEAVQAIVLTQGKAIAAQAFLTLSSRLREAIEQGGITNAIPYCSAAAMPLTAAIADTHGVALRRVSHRPRNPAGRADASELLLIEQYQTRLKAGQPGTPTVVGSPSGGARFYAPIIITNDLCLKCHGRIDKEVSLEAAVELRRLYPRDEAIDFRLGDLRGLWRIEFSAERLARTSPEGPSPH